MSIITSFCILGILLALLCGTSMAADLTRTLQYCCGLGREQALRPTKCGVKITLPIRNVRSDQQSICSSTIDLCCLQYWRDAACNAGTQAAKEDRTCDKEFKTDEDTSFKYCCEACKLGMACNSSASSYCDLSKIPFNSPWREAFISCTNLTSTSHKGNEVSDARRDPNLAEFTQKPFERSIQGSNYPNCLVGHKYDYKINGCTDVNECETSPCDNHEICFNTVGSYRCDCTPGFQKDRITGACIDINECQVNSHNCNIGTQRCDNTIGSYHCVRSVGCGTGYTFNSNTDDCEDDDECTLETDDCKIQGAEWECRNIPGSFRCVKKACNSRNCTPISASQLKVTKSCSRGFQVGSQNTCVDIDECKTTSICKPGLKCVNTIGGYFCAPSINCPVGLKLNQTTNLCEDINECEEQLGLCDHNCINVWGSFVCTCQPGFSLHKDNRSCVDINECELFKERRICGGTCLNVPGSYKCQCPDGYQQSPNGKWCQDIDECAMPGKCDSKDDCLNTQGSYRCNVIECPSNYVRDPNRKNRCLRASYYCAYDLSEECLQTPISYSFNYNSLASNISIPTSGFIELFNLSGGSKDDQTISIDLSLKVANVRAHSAVPRVEDDHFYLNRVSRNSTSVMLKRSIMGPQEIELHLKMNLYSKDRYFIGFNIFKLFIYVSQYDF